MDIPRLEYLALFCDLFHEKKDRFFSIIWIWNIYIPNFFYSFTHEGNDTKQSVDGYLFMVNRNQLQHIAN